MAQFWMINAFTQERFKGNPAGVFVCDHFPSDQIMQAIATELNWSQTAFVQIDWALAQKESIARAHIRWFSPVSEAPFCGHATLASAHVLWNEMALKVDSIEFESRAGKLYAKRLNDQISIDLPRKEVTLCPCPTALEEALVDDQGQKIPFQAVYRDDLIYVVVLQNTADLARLKPILSFIETLDTRAISVTTTGPDGFDFQSRYFAPKVGIPEDPVCGSSHARLGPLWSTYYQGKNPLRAYQASSRTGVLDVEMKEDRVCLTSHAVTVFSGRMDIPLFDKR